MDIDFIERLERRLLDDLPGQKAQLIMANQARKVMLEASNTYNEACVMILLFLKNKDWHLALIERTAFNPNDPHSGQLSLPGGRMEESDQTHSDCALRELHEEIGVNPEDIGVIGELSSLFVHVSDYLIYPFIGFTEREPVFYPQPSEVQEVIEIPLEIIYKDKFRSKKDIPVRNMILKDMPYIKVGDRTLWGATAMILSEFAEIIKELS